MNCAAATCPICGGPNECQLATTDAYKGPCWCAGETFTDALLASVPEEARRIHCICPRCVITARRLEMKARPLPRAEAGDFYIEGGRVVFTAQYHQRRGYCCGNGCRHCPFTAMEFEMAVMEQRGKP